MACNYIWLSKPQLNLNYIRDVQRNCSSLKENYLPLPAQAGNFHRSHAIMQVFCLFVCFESSLLSQKRDDFFWLCVYLFQCFSPPFCNHIFLNAFPIDVAFFFLVLQLALHSWEQTAVNRTACSVFPKMWWCTQWHDCAILPQIFP